MWSRRVAIVAALVLAACLSACGGGGGSGPAPDTSGSGAQDTTTQTDSVNAAAASLTAVVNLAVNSFRLQWQDTFASGSSYRVESQSADGTFSAVETLAGAGGTNTVMQWQRAVTVSTVYRVQAVLSGRTVPLLSPQGQTSLNITIPASAPQIVVDRAEPVSGTAILSLSNDFAYPSVAWYSDLRLIGNGAGASGNPVGWNTTSEANGSHQILARYQASPDSYVEVRRTVSVSNSTLAVNATVSGMTGTVNIDVRTSSQYGIARVEASFDGSPLGSLTAPNAGGGSFDVFRFTVNAAVVGSGDHTMVVTVTDAAGNSQQNTVAVPISNAPVVSLTSPVDGAFVYGTLQVNGSYATDRPGLVTVTASLGDYQFLQTTSQTFSGNFDIGGLTPGAYTLTVRATDSTNTTSIVQQTVIVTSSSALTQPQFALGRNGHMLAAEGDRLLYAAEDSSVRLRDTASGQEILLSNASTIASPIDWQVSGGKVYVQGKGADCVNVCIYQWASDGSITNLSNVNPYSATRNITGGRSADTHPVAHGSYIIWANRTGSNPGGYTLYDVTQGTYTAIAGPGDANYIGNINYDFTTQNGVVNFFYWAQTGGEFANSTFDVYRWSSDSQASTRLSSGGMRNIYPQTDGVRVAWSQSPQSTVLATTMSLMTQPVTGGATSTLSTKMSSFLLRDGVLSWVETTSTGQSLKASTQASISTLSILSSSLLYGAGGGFVVYGEQGKTYSWNALSGTVVLRIDAAPSQILVNGSTMYFVMGNTQTVYKLALN